MLGHHLRGLIVLRRHIFQLGFLLIRIVAVESCACVGLGSGGDIMSSAGGSAHAWCCVRHLITGRHHAVCLVVGSHGVGAFQVD